MTRSFVRSAALAAMMFAATPAFADWGDTKWGADRDATLAVLGPDAVAVQGTKDQTVDGQDWRAKRPGRFDGIAVEEDFYFDPSRGGLSAVRLEPVNKADCPAFIAAIRKRYPAPIEDSKKMLGTPPDLELARTTWADQTTDLAMMMAVIRFGWEPKPNFCQIVYQPYAAREKTAPMDTL